MPRGTPTDQLLDPENPGPVDQSVAHVDERGRIKLPAKIVGGVRWIGVSDALAVLDVPGLIRLISWPAGGELVAQRRRELIEQAESEPALLEVLRALEDRYKRFGISPSARPTLTPEMIMHLGLLPATPVSIYVWRIADTIELNTTMHRAQGLTVDWEELGDLP